MTPPQRKGTRYVQCHREYAQWQIFPYLQKKPATAVLKARSAILGDLQDNNFIAVVCGSGPLAANTYALSKSGKLLLFDNFRLVDKFTEIKVQYNNNNVM